MLLRTGRLALRASAPAPVSAPRWPASVPAPEAPAPAPDVAPDCMDDAPRFRRDGSGGVGAGMGGRREMAWLAPAADEDMLTARPKAWPVTALMGGPSVERMLEERLPACAWVRGAEAGNRQGGARCSLVSGCILSPSHSRASLPEADERPLAVAGAAAARIASTAASLMGGRCAARVSDAARSTELIQLRTPSRLRCSLCGRRVQGLAPSMSRAATAMARPTPCYDEAQAPSRWRQSQPTANTQRGKSDSEGQELWQPAHLQHAGGKFGRKAAVAGRRGAAGVVATGRRHRVYSRRGVVIGLYRVQVCQPRLPVWCGGGVRAAYWSVPTLWQRAIPAVNPQ